MRKAFLIPILAFLLLLVCNVASKRGEARIPTVEELLAKPSDGPYNATWPSLNSRPTPSWWTKARFGIYIFWGLYSVPSFYSPVGESYAEWYWDYIGGPNLNCSAPGISVEAQFHCKTYGEHFKYEDFAPMFKAELFDPKEWAELFKASGAKYTVITAKHHGGYCMWPSAQAWGWNSMDTGPHRDLVGEVMEATRQVGVRAGLYYSLFEWFNPNLWLNRTNRVYNNATQQSYVKEHMLPQMMDLVAKYEPDIWFSDGNWEALDTYWLVKPWLAWLFNQSPVKDKIVINDRWGTATDAKDGGYYCAEYAPTVFDHPWEEQAGLDVFSFGYNRVTRYNQYQTPWFVVWNLARIVSNGGNYMVNIGPEADGRIPRVMERILREVGTWLSINGDAIYESDKWRVTMDTMGGMFYGVQRGYRPSTETYANVPTTNIDECKELCRKDDKCAAVTFKHLKQQGEGACGGLYETCCYMLSASSPGVQAEGWDAWGKQGLNMTDTPVFYTTNKTTNLVYAILPRYPNLGTVRLASPIVTNNTQVRLLGGPTLSFEQLTPTGLAVTLPPLDEIESQYSYVLELNGVK